PVPEKDLTVPGRTDEDEAVEVGYNCTSRFDRVDEWQPDDASGHVQRQTQSRQIGLIDKLKDNRNSRPQFLSPAQHEFKCRSADGDHDTNRPVTIFFLEMPAQTFLVSRPPKAAQIEIFRIERGVRLSVGGQHRTQAGEYLIVKRPPRFRLSAHQYRSRAHSRSRQINRR